MVISKENKMNKQKILKKLDHMGTLEKIEYLNELFLKSTSKKDDDMILELLEGVKQFG